MPVDKFGHTDSGSMQRVVAGGVTLTQINNSFLRLDGSNDIVGDIDMGGHLLVGLPIDYPSAGNGDEAISFSQATALIADKITNSAAPTADDHLANKKYVDERDSTKVSKTGDTMTGNLFLKYRRVIERARWGVRIWEGKNNSSCCWVARRIKYNARRTTLLHYKRLMDFYASKGRTIL